jgi:hypothetical protein
MYLGLQNGFLENLLIAKFFNCHNDVRVYSLVYSFFMITTFKGCCVLYRLKSIVATLRNIINELGYRSILSESKCIFKYFVGTNYNGCFFKFGVEEVGVEESIVNAPSK